MSIFKKVNKMIIEFVSNGLNVKITPARNPILRNITSGLFIPKSINNKLTLSQFEDVDTIFKVQLENEPEPMGFLVYRSVEFPFLSADDIKSLADTDVSNILALTNGDIYDITVSSGVLPLAIAENVIGHNEAITQGTVLASVVKSRRPCKLIFEVTYA